MQLVTKFYATTLMRRSLKRFYNNRTMGMLKRNMQETADSYHNDNVMKKVFEQLLVHTYKAKTKKAMQKLADMHYKRNFIMKWMFVTHQRLQTKKSLENYNFSPRSAELARAPFRRQGTGLSTLSNNKSVMSLNDRSTVT